MKEKAKQLIKHPLIYGSSIVVFGTLIANFFNFLFNIFMLSNLSVSEYGNLATIIALIGYPLLLASALNPMVVKFAGNYFATNNIALLHGLYIKMVKIFTVFGLIFFFLFLIFLGEINSFFHINNQLALLITNIIILITFIGTINSSYLQAKLAFVFQVSVALVNAVLKLLLGIVFVFMGYSVTGAMSAMLFAGIGAYLFSFIPLKFIFSKSKEKPKIENKELFVYGLPSALTQLGLTSFIASDIMLVKHFFDPHQAGLYAGLSLVGRVIFYISSPIGSVMFPLIIQKHTKGENYTNTFKLAVFMVLLPSLFLTLLYFLFPDFFVLFFSNNNKEYLAVAPLLFLFSLSITFYCLLSLLAMFYLSINKTKIYIPILSGAILQIILIIFFHQTFIQVITISLVLTLLITLILLLYYPYATKKKEHKI